MSQASYHQPSFWQKLFAKNLPRMHFLAAGLAVFCLALTLVFLPSKEASAKRQTNDIQLSFKEALNPETAPKETATLVESSLQWQNQTVRNGDNLTSIFKRVSLNARDVYQVTSSSEHAKVLNVMRPGQTLQLGFDTNGLLAQLKYHKNQLESYLYTRSNNGFSSQYIELEPDVFTAYREGVINNSLYLAGAQANMPDSLIMELANIFGWDIDFVFDIRKGDSFSVLYEEKFLDGKKIGEGDILAAEFTNQGKTFRAVRYEHKNGHSEYYTPEGLSMRKEFLRAPLNVFRISSNFNLRRKHPIHKKVKAHRGVDYAAPRGTPVYSAGNGKVIASGYSKANGNYVFIQHGQRYVTKYLHLNKRSVRKGQTVTQRKVIGTVGSTGYTTGPHLHYEFLVNGVHRNPRTVKLPQAKPIIKAERQQFAKATHSLLARLDEYSQGRQLAIIETSPIATTH